MASGFGVDDAPIPEDRKEKVRIKIKREEREYFGKLFAAAKAKGNNKVTGKEALDFFRKSRLPGGLLQKIWAMAAQSNPASLDRDEFYVALRLVALAQARREVSLAAIANNVDAPLPFFETFKIPASAQPQYPTMQMPMMPGMVPMMGPAGMSMMMPQAMQQTMSPSMAPPMAAPAPMPVASTGPHGITPEELAKYSRIFDGVDKRGTGQISSEQMTALLKKTNLPETVLGSVWELIEASDSGSFDKANTIMALHLLVKYKARVPLPVTMPAELRTTVRNFLQGGAAAPIPQMMSQMPQVPLAMPSDPNDPFAEIGPTQAFAGGAAPLYSFPQLMPAPTPAAMAMDPRSQSQPQSQPQPMMMIPPPTDSQNELCGGLMGQLVELDNEIAGTKRNAAGRKAEIAQEEENTKNLLASLAQVSSEYVELTKELLGGRRPAQAMAQAATIPQKGHSPVKAAGNGRSASGFSWDNSVPSTGGARPVAGRGGIKAEAQEFEFS